MARIVHFDVTADQPEQLMSFYKTVFQWKFSKWEGPMEYWLIETGPDEQPGINGGLGRRQGNDRIVNTIDVNDIDAVLDQIKEQGGKILMEKGPMPGVGWYAEFEDPQGNLFGLMEDDPSAQ